MASETVKYAQWGLIFCAQCRRGKASAASRAVFEGGSITTFLTALARRRWRRWKSLLQDTIHQVYGWEVSKEAFMVDGLAYLMRPLA